jgi:predicted nucleic acid-binding protein
MSAGVYADTSLLASLYLADANTARAIELVTKIARPLILTSWQEFELENAFQLRRFRQESTSADLAVAATQLAGDKSAGMVVAVTLALASVVPLARQLAARHTAVCGSRAFDVFHVASAVHLGSRQFLSFDHRQLALARAVGLRVFPVKG